MSKRAKSSGLEPGAITTWCAFIEYPTRREWNLATDCRDWIRIAQWCSLSLCFVKPTYLPQLRQSSHGEIVRDITRLAMSLENIFRLINAVIVTPSEDSTVSRIGHAFGETAPVALASTVHIRMPTTKTGCSSKNHTPSSRCV